jgi:phosphomannomutase
LVDDTGRAIGEDYTLALATRVVLRHRKGAVVTNLSTSRIVDDMAAEHGVSVVRAPVGEVNVALKMRAVDAVIGGEGNGGVILPELHLGRDAPLGVALLLQLLHEDAEPLSRIVERFPRYTIIKDKLDRPAKPLDAVRGRRGGHAGRIAAGLERSLGAHSSERHGADCASNRRGAYGG